MHRRGRLMSVEQRSEEEKKKQEKMHAWIVEWTNVSMLKHKAISQI